MDRRIKEPERLIAFLALLMGLLFVVSLLMFHTPSNEYVLRILDAAVGGLTLALGVAAQALFRGGEKDAEALRELAAAPAKTVVVDQPPDKPIPVAPAPDEDDHPHV